MKQESFYIIIHNRWMRHEYGDKDFHLEKMFNKEDVLEFIKCRSVESCFHHELIIITNDDVLLSNYIFTINEEEFKMLCGLEKYDKRSIRINSSTFEHFNESSFDYYLKIRTNEIISANMDYVVSTFYPYDHDSSIRRTDKLFNGWLINKEFLFFETPIRYLNKEKSNLIFGFKNIKKANLDTLNNLVNTNILEIGKVDNHPAINWEFKNSLLRYYDETTKRRLYISQGHLNTLSKNNEIVFTIETKLDINNYIEYHVKDIETIDEFYTEDSNQTIFDDQNSPKYDKYNGVHGLDDETIESAFEGDPDNYWNID